VFQPVDELLTKLRAILHSYVIFHQMSCRHFIKYYACEHNLRYWRGSETLIPAVWLRIITYYNHFSSFWPLYINQRTNLTPRVCSYRLLYRSLQPKLTSSLQVFPPPFIMHCFSTSHILHVWPPSLYSRFNRLTNSGRRLQIAELLRKQFTSSLAGPALCCQKTIQYYGQ
jgi:hypothetical protein